MWNVCSEVICGLRHGIRAVSDEDSVARGVCAGLLDFRTLGICKFERVLHEKGLGLQFEAASTFVEHFLQMGFFEIQGTVEFIVFFIKGPAGDKNLNHVFVDVCELKLLKKTDRGRNYQETDKLTIAKTLNLFDLMIEHDAQNTSIVVIQIRPLLISVQIAHIQC